MSAAAFAAFRVLPDREVREGFRARQVRWGCRGFPVRSALPVLWVRRELPEPPALPVLWVRLRRLFMHNNNSCSEMMR